MENFLYWAGDGGWLEWGVEGSRNGRKSKQHENGGSWGRRGVQKGAKASQCVEIQGEEAKQALL